MAEITFLGTCSGTEPMIGLHHSSFVIEENGLYYWFDAGENCSHMGYTLGIDVSRIRAVFISHMHIDHVGGLANLIFTIRKVAWRRKTPHINNNSYDVFVPDLEKFQAIKEIGNGYKAPEDAAVFLRDHQVSDGLVYEDQNIRVSALHNNHLKEADTGDWHSYSYKIEVGGKVIVFSGDVAYPAELDPFVEAGCDILIMETGHHKVSDVCDYAKSRNIKQLLFTHHGREMLASFDAAEELIVKKSVNAKICRDGEKIKI